MTKFDQHVTDKKFSVEKGQQVELTYDNLSMNEALRILLPDSVKDRDIPSGFETIGDIAHLNLQHNDLVENRFKIG